MKILVGLMLVLAPSLAGQTHVLVVSGIGGEPRYQAAFLETGLAVVAAAETRLAVPAPRVVLLAEDPSRNTRIAARSSKENITTALAAIAQEAEPNATVLIVFIGHGSANADGARINLPGPDLTARELAALLVPFETQQVIVVNAASASGDWVRVLAGPRRAVLTATRSAVERDETRFGGHFAAALGSEDADRDKDGLLSVFEAFEYARREVERAYERDQRLRTEHALLEADGDGVGALAPVVTAGDGAVAAVLFLGDRPTSSPRATGLVAVRDSLQQEVARLRARKESLPAAEYERQLEVILLELARVTRELRERDGGRP